jgi:hypothetical protein
MKTKRDPWTDPDPQPGDLDEYLATLGPDDFEHHEGNPDAKVLHITEEEADRVRGIGLKPGEDPRQVVEEIVRKAEAREEAR